MNGNIRAGNLFGIPFYINFSWFLVFALVTWQFGQGLAEMLPGAVLLPWILGMVAALLLFASVLAHELGHSLVALRQGIEVKSINLFIFGGLAMLGQESKTPWQSFSVAIAGPLVSLVLFALLTAIDVFVPLPGVIGAIVGLVAQINLILALFNLLPGLPLDGGNVLKSLVWKITGNPNKGILAASRVGQFLGSSAVVLGALSIFGISNYGSIWTLFIGLFLLQNAGIAAQTAIAQDKLDGFTAAEAIIPESPLVSQDLNLREFANNYVIGQTRWQTFWVTNDLGQPIGTISANDLKPVPTSDWPHTRIAEIAQPLAADTISVQADLSLLEVVKLLEAKQLKELPVIGEDGTISGLLEKASIVRLLQQKDRAPVSTQS